MHPSLAMTGSNNSTRVIGHNSADSSRSSASSSNCSGLPNMRPTWAAWAPDGDAAPAHPAGAETGPWAAAAAKGHILWPLAPADAPVKGHRAKLPFASVAATAIGRGGVQPETRSSMARSALPWHRSSAAVAVTGSKPASVSRRRAAASGWRAPAVGEESSATMPKQISACCASRASTMHVLTMGCPLQTPAAASPAKAKKADQSSREMPSFASSKPREVTTSGPPALEQISSVAKYLSPARLRRFDGSRGRRLRPRASSTKRSAKCASG
mmetsp:Transcript_105689/g.235940  ORF Transcript_105689/g.235940 Transcript_105689/m.235940 type:complete len:270 (-) Transcript_105689:18-827(-)